MGVVAHWHPGKYRLIYLVECPPEKICSQIPQSSLMQAFALSLQFVVSFQVGTEFAIGTRGYLEVHPALFLRGYILRQLDCFDRRSTQKFEERECSTRRGANRVKVRFRLLSLGGR
jgi:hypothetical protein